LCPELKPYLGPWRAPDPHEKTEDSLLCEVVFLDRSLLYCFSALPIGDDRRGVTLAPSYESFMRTVKANAGDGGWHTQSAALAHYGIRLDSGHSIAIDRLVEEISDLLLSGSFL